MKAKLSDNALPARFHEAVRLGKKIIGAVDTRSERIAELGIDPRFGFPDANWHPKERNDFRSGYDLLATLGWDQVRYLRFRAQNFSGFSLLHMERGVGRSNDPVPPNYDDIFPEKCPQDVLDLWSSKVKGIPLKFIFRPKPMLGEVGWWVGNVLVNFDTATYQERMFLLCNAELLTKPRKILEIGGGYGALAYAILGLPGVEYWICDLPESLLFSGLYLTMTTDLDVKLWPERGSITLVPNYLFEQIDVKFDLFINTLSLAEMTEHQARIYVSGIHRLMSNDGKFFEQNHLNNDLPDGTHQASVKQICSETFANRTTLSIPDFINGPADVWSN
jgi:hypothetical protein